MAKRRQRSECAGGRPCDTAGSVRRRSWLLCLLRRRLAHPDRPSHLSLVPPRTAPRPAPNGSTPYTSHRVVIIRPLALHPLAVAVCVFCEDPVVCLGYGC